MFSDSIFRGLGSRERGHPGVARDHLLAGCDSRREPKPGKGDEPVAQRRMSCSTNICNVLGVPHERASKGISPNGSHLDDRFEEDADFPLPVLVGDVPHTRQVLDFLRLQLPAAF